MDLRCQSPMPFYIEWSGGWCLGKWLLGLGKLKIETFKQAIESQVKFPAGLASPAGLTLVEVKY